MPVILDAVVAAAVMLENGTTVPPEDVMYYQWQTSRYGYERSISWYTGGIIEVELSANPKCYRTRAILDPDKHEINIGGYGEWLCLMNADDE